MARKVMHQGKLLGSFTPANDATDEGNFELFKAYWTEARSSKLCGMCEQPNVVSVAVGWTELPDGNKCQHFVPLCATCRNELGSPATNQATAQAILRRNHLAHEHVAQMLENGGKQC